MPDGYTNSASRLINTIDTVLGKIERYLTTVDQHVNFDPKNKESYTSAVAVIRPTRIRLRQFTQLDDELPEEEERIVELLRVTLELLDHFAKGLPDPPIPLHQNSLSDLNYRLNTIYNLLTIAQSLGSGFSESVDFRFMLKRAQRISKQTIRIEYIEKPDFLERLDDIARQLQQQSKRIDVLADSNVAASNRLAIETMRSLASENEDFEGRVENLLSNANGRFNRALDDISLSADSMLQEIRDKLHLAETLVAASGTEYTSREYELFSNRQKRQADLLLVLAVIIFTISVVVVGWLVNNDSLQLGSAFQSAILKVTISLPLTILAFILVKDSRELRNTSNSAKDMRLRLVAFEPFLANVDTGKAEALREELVRQLFISSELGFRIKPVDESTRK